MRLSKSIFIQFVVISSFIASGFSVFAQTLKTASLQTAPKPLLVPSHGVPIKVAAARPDGKLDAFVVTKDGKTITYFKDRAVFSQGNANMTADSSRLYTNENRLEAFGHVVIHQADTVTITGDKLFYDGGTQKAEMFDHCVMTDKQGVLTTDRLNYDLGTKVGTYFDGGKIINKDNILVSRTGYYYENTKICYFKTDVSILTPQTTIKSDTLQYNTNTRIAYFFGPTKIQSRDDFIYCENGQYNTANDQANFRQHAYYLNGSKKLVGDSLYYDKRSGFGRAIGHVVFTDSTDNGIIRGGIAQYNKVNEQTYVTHKPLFIFLTTASDTLKQASKTVDSLKPGVKGKIRPVKERTPTYAEILAGHSEEISAGQPGANPSHAPIPDLSIKKNQAIVRAPKVLKERVDSTFLTADTLMTLSLTGEKARPHLAPRIPLKVRNRPFAHDSLGRVADQLVARIKTAVIEDSLKLKNTAIKPLKDKSALLPVSGNLKSGDQLTGLSNAIATRKSTTKLKTGTVAAEKSSPVLTNSPVGVNSPDTSKVTNLKDQTDTRQFTLKPGRKSFFSRLFGKKSLTVRVIDTPVNMPVKISVRQLDSLKKKLASLKGDYQIPDLLAFTGRALRKELYKPFTFADTTHFRVVFAYHHAKLFKSDFQAAADSLVYTYIDSTIRCFKKPALWTEGAQMTGDTISIRLKDKKLDSLIIIHSSFIISRVDSLINKERFNQISGRDMFGKFNNNHLERMRVEGNGKSLYYATDDKKDSVTHKIKSTISGLNSEIGSYFLMRFKENKAESFTAVDEPEGHFFPLKKIDPGSERLKGFYWRESERPRSKADLFLKPKPEVIKEDSIVNKKSATGALDDDYSENILDIPKPKVKKGAKPAKGVLLKRDTGLLTKPVSPELPLDKTRRNNQFVPPADSTLSRTGVGDTLTHPSPK